MRHKIINHFALYKRYIKQHFGDFYRFITQRPSRTIKTTAILTVLLFVPQMVLSWQAYEQFENITTQEVRLQSLSDKVIYLDEVLTMSARMNAATGNQMWEKRYRQFEPKLDAAIAESISLAPKVFSSKNAKQTDAANQKLVQMEYQSFDLVKNGQKELAQELLLSKQYRLEKQKYRDGVKKINFAISKGLEVRVIAYREKLLFISFFAGFCLVMLIPAWIIVLRLLNQYLKQRQVAQLELQKTNQQLEIRVEERTQELRDKNNQIQETLQELQDTQIQLIHTEKMSGLGQLVGGVAHEINNPVTFIDGNIIHAKQYTQDLLNLVELYQQHFPNPPVEIEDRLEIIELDFIKEDIFKIYQSMELGTSRIRDIVLSLRNFSRLDEADFKRVDIHQGIDSTLMILQNRLKLKRESQEIAIIKEYNQLPLVECYPSQLNQALANILANAIDAIEKEVDDNKNQIKPQIRISTELSDCNYAVIKISDNGCGMTEKVHSKIFDPFFTTKPVGDGTGLGLSITYKIISKHNGKLYCNSQLGQGAEFIIEIPVNF